MSNVKRLGDYDYYAQKFLKIQTKVNGLQPFKRRAYQKRFSQFLESIKGAKRVIVLKPRQAGFSTDTAGYMCHKMMTLNSFRGIAMADKSGRTDEIANIYKNFIMTAPKEIVPHIGKMNSERIDFDVTKSGISFETAHDPNAGRSTNRLFAHLTEAAFYRYYKEIDEGIQNSIPLHENSVIIKESTANGKGGIGKPFYMLWNSAKAGESIYKHFFVAWYEIDDYQIDPGHGFKLTKEESEIMRVSPLITKAHLAWRRLKISEYLDDGESEFLTPEERFKQDFPLTDNEAFLSTGSPIFDPISTNILIESLTRNKVPELKDALRLESGILQQYKTNLKIFSPPRKGKTYFIGGDVAEGLAQGDNSSAFVMDESYNQVAAWTGKIEPDMFGYLLIALGDMYNKAVIVPENNNMGHTTVNTIRNEGYSRLYRERVEDKLVREFVTKYGWRTTRKSKMDMLNEFCRYFRDGETRIMDLDLANEMTFITREENGDVNLNGRDRVVAACLAHMGRKHYKGSIEIKTKKSSIYEVPTVESVIKEGQKKLNPDMFD